jgi:hypothetical protein
VRTPQRPATLIEEAAHEDAPRPDEDGGRFVELVQPLVDVAQRVPDQAIGIAAAAR